MCCCGVPSEWALMRGGRGGERTAMSLLVSYAVAVIIEGALYQAFGSTPVGYLPGYAVASVHVLGFYLPYIYLIGFGLAPVALAATHLLPYRTHLLPSLPPTTH